MAETAEKTYLSCAETAKLVRAALKKAFPGTKFSVRSDTYSGGASIRVRYTDGPLKKDVEAVAKRFAGADFDGMIDLKYHHNHYLLPDGTVRWASTYGHSYENGAAPYTMDDMPEGTRMVRFGADYVFVDRDLSPERDAEVKAEIARVAGVDEFSFSDDYDVAVIDGELRRCGGLPHYSRYATGIYQAVKESKDYSEGRR